MNVNTYSDTRRAVLLDSIWPVPVASAGGDTTCDSISYGEWVSEGKAAVSGAAVASPAVAGSYQNTLKTREWPSPCPGCAHLRKSPACAVTITLSKATKHIQVYTELPARSSFSRALGEKKRASSGLLLGHWKIPFLKTQRLWKIYVFLHALPPWHNPKEACAQEAAHLVSSVSWRTGEIEQKSFAICHSAISTNTLSSHLQGTSHGFWKSKSF